MPYLTKRYGRRCRKGSNLPPKNSAKKAGVNNCGNKEGNASKFRVELNILFTVTVKKTIHHPKP